jgi:hypothetical protein
MYKTSFSNLHNITEELSFEIQATEMASWDWDLPTKGDSEYSKKI